MNIQIAENILPEAQHILPPVEFLHECFTYEENGDLTWKERPQSHFKTKAAFLGTNRKTAGQNAITISNNYRVVVLGGKVHRAAKIIYKMHTGLEYQSITYKDNDKSNTRIENLEPTDSTAFYRSSPIAQHRLEKLPFGVQERKNERGRPYYVAVVCFGGKGYRVGASFSVDEAEALQLNSTRRVEELLLDIRSRNSINSQSEEKRLPNELGIDITV